MAFEDDAFQKETESSPPETPFRQLERRQQWKKYFFAEVSTNHADILFLASCLISGLVDSTVYNAYGTFVSMQTGSLSPSPQFQACD